MAAIILGNVLFWLNQHDAWAGVGIWTGVPVSTHSLIYTEHICSLAELVDSTVQGANWYTTCSSIFGESLRIIGGELKEIIN